MNEKLISGENVEDLLLEACSTRARIWISTGDSEPYIFMNVYDLEDDTIILRGKLINEEVKRLQRQETFFVSYFLKGRGVYTFETHFIDKQKLKTNWCPIHRPRKIIHTQRRQAFRICPAVSLPLDCSKLSETETEGKVKVENISLKGGCLSFPKNAAVKEGMVIKDIQLRFNDGTVIMVSGIISRYWMKPNGRFFIGLEWMRLARKEEIVIRDYIAAAQREMEENREER